MGNYIIQWSSAPYSFLMTQRDGIGEGGREAEEERIYVYLELIHVVQQKL